MKTNVLKSAVLFAALSIAFISCEKDSLVTEMESKKVKSEQIIPMEKRNDRELERKELDKLPIMKENNLTPTANTTPTPTPIPTSKPSPVKKKDNQFLNLKEAAYVY